MEIPLDRHDIIVGFFVLAGLITAAGLIVFQAGPDLFDFGSIEVHTYLPSTYGLKRGVPVSYLQFTVGHVKRVELVDPDAPEKKVKVTFTITERFRPVVKKNFTSSLEREQLGGILSGNIILSPPDPPAGPSSPLEDGDELAYMKTESLFTDITNLSDQLREVLLPRMNAILEEFDIFLKSLNDPDGDARRMMANMRETSEVLLEPGGDLRRSLARANELMGQLVDENNNLQKLLRDEKLHEDLTATIQNARDLSERGKIIVEDAGRTADEILSASRAVVEEAGPKINAILDEVIELERRAGRLLGDIEYIARKTREASTSLPALVEDVQEQLRQVDEIARAAKNIFLIRWNLEDEGIEDPVIVKPLLLKDPSGKTGRSEPPAKEPEK